jgi:fatty acid desaturase
MRKELYAGFRKQLNFSFQWPKLVQHVLIDGLFLAAITGLMSQNAPWNFVAILPISMLIFRNFGLMHEAVHNQAHPHSLLNSIMGVISGCLCLLPYYLWKKIHLEHHYWAGNVDKDPTLEIVKRYPASSSKMQAWMSFCWRTRLPFPAFVQHVVFWGHATRLWLKNIKEPMYWIYLFGPVAFWTGVILMLDTTQLGILFGSIGLYLYMVEAINFPHHAGAYIEDSSLNKNHLPVWEQHLVARSCVYPKWFQSLVLLHFNYHIEHHTFPDLPWHQLDRAHRLLTGAPELAPQLIIIGNSWLEERRQGTFGEFVRPTPASIPNPQSAPGHEPEPIKKSAA